jgi:chromosome segregation ATPase
MKSFLQSLLVILALSLCGMISFQWVRETHMRKRVQELTDTVHDKAEAIQNLQTEVRRDEDEIKRLDGLKNQFKEQVKSNEVEIAASIRKIHKAEGEIEELHTKVEEYQNVVREANANVLRANENIQKQKETIEGLRKVAEDRNELAVRLNKMATDYKALVEKWNQQQEELQKAAATNAPAKK